MLETVGDVVEQDAAADDATVSHCWEISGTSLHTIEVIEVDPKDSTLDSIDFRRIWTMKILH